MIKFFAEKVDDKLSQFDGVLSMMEGARRILVEDALRDYCRVSVQLDEVTASVVTNGFTITDGNGKPKRNPDIMTQHQLLNEKNALLPKLLKALPDDAARDALASFVAGD